MDFEGTFSPYQVLFPNDLWNLFSSLYLPAVHSFKAPSFLFWTHSPLPISCYTKRMKTFLIRICIELSLRIVTVWG